MHGGVHRGACFVEDHQRAAHGAPGLGQIRAQGAAEAVPQPGRAGFRGGFALGVHHPHLVVGADLLPLGLADEHDLLAIRGELTVIHAAPFFIDKSAHVAIQIHHLEDGAEIKRVGVHHGTEQDTFAIRRPAWVMVAETVIGEPFGLGRIGDVDHIDILYNRIQIASAVKTVHVAGDAVRLFRIRFFFGQFNGGISHLLAVR